LITEGNWKRFSPVPNKALINWRKAWLVPESKQLPFTEIKDKAPYQSLSGFQRRKPNRFSRNWYCRARSGHPVITACCQFWIA
jgi:hypothetical protein